MTNESVTSAALTSAVDSYAASLDRHLAGDTSAEEFRHLRVPMGIYEQRKDDTFMIRVRLTGGLVTSDHLIALADIAGKRGISRLHFTTRQGIQLHEVDLADTADMLQELLSVGLNTRGACGDTLRNIAVVPSCDACPGPVFDVWPYALALAEFLAGLEGSYTLPRKLKIAFSGCRHDPAQATINDAGFVAAAGPNDEPGFELYGAGGLGAKPRLALRLEDWIPATEIGVAAEALRRTFDRLGDRSNRARARLRFVAEKLGDDAFRDLYLKEKQGLIDANDPSAHICEGIGPEAPRDAAAEIDADFSLPAELAESEWAQRCVRPDVGGFRVQLHLRQGDATPADLRDIAALARKFGSGLLHAAKEQNLRILGVAPDDLAALGRALVESPQNFAGVGRTWNLTSCTGAKTCRLGICNSRGLLDAIDARLAEDGLSDILPRDVRVQISGCPNNCGQHSAGAVGFSGAKGKVNSVSAPFYHVHLGGHIEAGKARLARRVGKVPARAVPGLVVDLAAGWQNSTSGSFLDYVSEEGGEAERTVERHADPARAAAIPHLESDW